LKTAASDEVSASSVSTPSTAVVHTLNVAAGSEEIIFDPPGIGEELSVLIHSEVDGSPGQFSCIYHGYYFTQT